MEKQKYGCFKTSNIADRCMKLSIYSDYEPSYETEMECMKNCNLPEEEEALRKLREKFRLKSLLEKIQPSLIESFDKIKDIPLLNYNNEPYNKTILNSKELQHLYSTIVTNDIFKDINPNHFLIDLISKLEVEKGKEIIIIKNSNDNYESELFNDNKDFISEINNIKYNFMIKGISILNNLSPNGHQSIMLIKKEGEILTFFLYDPTVSNEFILLYDKIESFIKKINDKYKVIHLSKLYGIQNIEFNNYNTEKVYDYIDNEIIKNVKHIYSNYLHFMNLFIINAVEYIFNNIKNILETTEIEKYNNLKSLKLITPMTDIIENYININAYLEKYEFIKYFMNDIFKKYLSNGRITQEQLIIVKQELIKMGKFFFTSITPNHLLEDTVKIYIENIIDNLINGNLSSFLDFNDLIKKKINNFNKEHIKLLHEKEKFNDILLKQYNIDYFSGYCYMWCYYIIILIILNKNLDPYIIIKATFYQTVDIEKMKKILDFQISDIQKYNKLDKLFFLQKDYISSELKKIEENIHNLELKETNEIFLLRRKLFLKITNFLLLNVLYNKSYDKYLSYKIKDDGDKFNNFIPQKVDELLNNYSLPDFNNLLCSDVFRKTFINRIIEGELLIDINKKIDLISFKEKYLKYKTKYLQLKKLNK
jgi:hypothetical protein